MAKTYSKLLLSLHLLFFLEEILQVPNSHVFPFLGTKEIKEVINSMSAIEMATVAIGRVKKINKLPCETWSD